MANQRHEHERHHRRRRTQTAGVDVAPSAPPRPCLLLLLLSTLALATTAAAARLDPAPREEAFIGWNGESYHPGGGGSGSGSGAADEGEGHAPGEGPSSAVATQAPAPRVEVLSWRPRAFLYRNFLNATEARHFQRAAARVLRHSTVVGEKGESVLRGDYRTSYGCFLRRRSDAVMAAVSRRAAALVGIPEMYAEDMQVLRYSKGQQYRAHMDSLRDDKAGPRVATMLLYFNDVPKGGETAFPDTTPADWASPEAERRYGRDPQLSACAKGHVAARPKKGDALLFWSIRPDGHTDDLASMHAGCPVEEGVKWTGTIWFHPKPFREEWFNATRDPSDTADPGDCEDLHAQCASWAKTGECERNPQYMRGDDGHLGKCRASCKACEVCGKKPAAAAAAAGAAGGKRADDDDPLVAKYKACRAINRHKAGYLVYDQDFDDPDEGVAAGLEALRRAGVADAVDGAPGAQAPAAAKTQTAT